MKRLEMVVALLLWLGCLCALERQPGADEIHQRRRAAETGADQSHR